MRQGRFIGFVCVALLAIVQMALSAGVSAQEMKERRVISEKTVSGFAFPESVAYDPQAKVLYVGQFGSELKPTQKDGKGKISKVSLSGKVLEDQFLPAKGEVLHKPKGIWVMGDRLWVTDIDVVWVFDLKTRQGKKAELPGIQFANDPTLLGTALYVSDNRGDQLYRVEPADFLHLTEAPKVRRVFAGQSMHPNGLYPAHDGSLLLVGFKSADDARGIYALSVGGETKTLSESLGRLDGVYETPDGTLLVTDWNSGALAQWSAKTGLKPLASGFKGPADFCVVPNADGLLVVVPDLVKGELRLVQLSP